MPTESLPTQLQLNRVYETGDISASDYSRIRKQVARRMRKGEPLTIEGGEKTELPSRAELNAQYISGQIDKKEYRRQRRLIIAKSRRGTGRVRVTTSDDGEVIITTANQRSAEARYGLSWRFDSPGGFSFVFYLGMVLLTVAVMVFILLGLFSGSASPSSESVDKSILLSYIIPAGVTFIFGMFGAIHSRGRSWGVATIILSILLNPMFVAFGIIGNPTWSILTQLSL